MFIKPEQIEVLKRLKQQRYESLPAYARWFPFWVWVWSWRQASTWSSFNPTYATDADLKQLIGLSESAWFFKLPGNILVALNSLIYPVDGPPNARVSKEIRIDGVIKKPVFTHCYTHLHFVNPYLSVKEQVFFADTCGWARDLLKKQSLGNLLRLLVAQGKQETVEEMVRKHPELLLEKGNVTDYSGREFKNITAFQYALWALDRHMWEAILANLPGEKAEEIRKALFDQYQALEQKGVKYTVDGRTVRGEKHFNFDTLIQAIETYLDHSRNWTFEEYKQHWCKEVGSAQYFVPAHVAQEYCSADPSSFGSEMFQRKKLPRTTQFYNKFAGRNELWWSPRKLDVVNKLGVDFAIARKWGAEDRLPAVLNLCAENDGVWGEHHAILDFLAMSTLSTKRMGEFVALHQILLTSVDVHKEPERYDSTQAIHQIS